MFLKRKFIIFIKQFCIFEKIYNISRKNGKPVLDGLPATYVEQENEAGTFLFSNNPSFDK